MECSNCNHTIPAGAKFCSECGAPLRLICPQCSHENVASSKFCSECGHSLAKPALSSKPSDPLRTDTPQQAHSVPGERRQATILFSDLSGYTAMNEKLDPEEVEAIMRRIKDKAVRIVENHEGVVNQFIGDEIMALFGIPIAHEDDPLRAAKTALELHEMVRQISLEVETRTGQPLKMHTGIHTGLVVTALHDNRDGLYGLTGDTVNTGSRLGSKAGPDEILVSPEMQRLISPFFETEALEAVKMKGKAKPVVPYRVIAGSKIQSRFDASKQKGFTTYTGRDQDVATLHARLAKAGQADGQFVTVVGEAGIGKSRLLYEFRHSLDREKFTIFQGRCQSYGSDTPYLPFLDVLRQILHLREDDSQAELLEKVISMITAIDASLKQYIPIYLHLLSIQSDYPLPGSLEGDALRQIIQEALSAVITLNTAQNPVLLILEDWHWSDEASEGALKHLIGVIASFPLMVVVNYRPNYRSNWGNLSYHTPVVLSPLDASRTKSIIKSVLGAARLPQELGTFIYKRTSGNPFFTEEVCYSMAEEGVVVVKDGQATLTHSLKNLALPDTVQAIIRTRLDRLDNATKETLQLASVIGRVFARRILEQIHSSRVALSESLDALKALEMIVQTQVLPEPEYTFKHVLTQEVAYQTLLLQRRKVLHDQVGKAIEELYKDRFEEQVNLLCHHFSLAENWPKAVYYGRQVAEKATRLCQYHEAVTMLEQIQAWLLRLPEDQARQENLTDALLQQERLYETLGQREKQQAIIDQLLSLLQPTDDRASLAEVYVRQGELCTQVGRFDEAEHVLSEALTIRRALSDVVGESSVLRSMGFLRWQQEQYEEALVCNEAALDLDRHRGDPTTIAIDLTNLGALFRSLNNHKRALECLEEALQIYETIQNLAKLNSTLYNIAHVHRELGDLERALLYYQRIYVQLDDIAPDHDNFSQLVGQVKGLSSIAAIYWQQGKTDESLRIYKDVVNMTRGKYGDGLLHALRMLGELLLTVKKPQEALRYLLESTTVLSELEDPESEAEIWGKIADIYDQNLADYQKAFAAWDKVRTFSVQMHNHPGTLEALQQMGRLAHQHLNEPKQALHHLSQALDLAKEEGDLAKQGELLNTMGIIEWKRSKYTHALTHYEQALRICYELEDTAHAGLILNSIGVTLRGLGRDREALIRLKEAVATNCRSGKRLFEGHGLAVMGDIYRDLGEYDRAIRQYQASIDIRRGIGDRSGEGWMLYSLASVHKIQNLSVQAHDCINQGLSIAEECRDEELHRVCIQLQNELTEGKSH